MMACMKRTHPVTLSTAAPGEGRETFVSDYNFFYDKIATERSKFNSYLADFSTIFRVKLIRCLNSGKLSPT